MPISLQDMIVQRRKLAAELAILDRQIEAEALRLADKMEENTAHPDEEEGSQPVKADRPKRKRRTEKEMERDVTAAIRYLIDEEHNGATQREAEKRFGLPGRILSKGKWAEMIEKYRRMR